ncbi:protein kinase [Actinoplanes sp. NPDC024001]|uniref:serine/threonine-protein kinase n=1 Tax=Actinoplanes sp. NPDC024001 TaxID=3154598 RepID=UPI0033C5800B
MGDTERIGRYLLGEEIGRGACAVVHRATAPGEPPLAVKLLRPDLAASPRVRDLLSRIGGTLHQLPHDGIVRMRDLVAEPGRLALVMELVDGPSVRAYVAAEGGTLPLETAAAVAAQVADVLADVHARGIVHLDLKPENVLLVGGARPPRVKVGDFGMAALPAEPDTVDNPYAAPERAAGGPPTAAADVYALGVLLAEMTSGTRPAPGRSGLHRIPRPVRDVVRDCLAVHPWERPPAADVAARIRAAVVLPLAEETPTEKMPPRAWPPQELPPQEVPPTRLLGLPRRSRRRRTVLLAGVASAVLVAALTGIAVRIGSGDPPVAAPPSADAGPGTNQPKPAQTVEREKLGATAPPARATYAARLPGAAGTLSLAVRDGRAIAYLCDGSRVEAWLKGGVVDGSLSLTGRDGAELTGRTDRRRATGQVTVGGRSTSFSIPRVQPPSGLYRAAARLRNAEIKGGWIVLPDGSQVGVLTRDGVAAPAPRLDTGERSAEISGDTLPAVPVDVTSGTGF